MHSIFSDIAMMTVTLTLKDTLFCVLELQKWISLKAVILLIKMYSCNFCIAIQWRLHILIKTAWYPKYLQESAFETVLFPQD